LHYLREAFLHEAIQHFVNLLPGHVSARRKFQGFESRMTHQNQIRAGLVGVQSKLLQPSPEPLKFNFGQLSCRFHVSSPQRVFQSTC